jgi:hypothetical protein
VRAAARWSTGLAAAWAGVLLCIAAMAAPSAFAVLSRADAGRYVGRLFAEEAYLSLGLGMLMFFVERRRARVAAEAGAGSVFSAEMIMLLGTIFCTVAGWFAVEPMMAAARLGQGAWSFGALHALSGGFFLLKLVLVAALAWRFSRL